MFYHRVFENIECAQLITFVVVVDGINVGIAVLNPAAIHQVKVGNQLVIDGVQCGHIFTAAPDEAENGVIHIAMKLKHVVGDIVALGIAYHLDAFDRTIGIFPDDNMVAVNRDHTAQRAVGVVFFEINRHGAGADCADIRMVVENVDGARARAVGARNLIFGVVDNGNQVFAGLSFDFIIGNIQRVIHFLLMIAKFDAVGLHRIFIQSQIFNGVAADFKIAGIGALQIFKLRVGLHLNAGIAVISVSRVVVDI